MGDCGQYISALSPSPSTAVRLIKFKVPHHHLPSAEDMDEANISDAADDVDEESVPEEEEDVNVDILTSSDADFMAISAPVPKRPKRTILPRQPPSPPKEAGILKKKIARHGHKKPLKQTLSSNLTPKSKSSNPMLVVKKPASSASVSSKKEKGGAIRIQEMPGYISDMRQFVDQMQSIRLRPWECVKVKVNGIGGMDPSDLPTAENENFMVLPIWMRRSDGGNLMIKPESIKPRKRSAVTPALSVAKPAACSSSVPSSASAITPSGSTNVIELLGMLLKNIPATADSPSGYACKVPRCGKNFLEKEKYRRHLHNHVRTIKHQQARGVHPYGPLSLPTSPASFEDSEQ